ncbi:hypothetical protein Pcinc_029540 [Petrolisthes cinctipes]|uniref:Uncharacterized protein n=1 Tax=Petrolisthes cinctipes TaxID=88211 RepID=A0AAE1F0M8_PETCI|nr:hypothetical protein Pcinc_029540 [Petrolisthes cinctipes]
MNFSAPKYNIMVDTVAGPCSEKSCSDNYLLQCTQLVYFFQEACCPDQGPPGPFKRKWTQRAIQEDKHQPQTIKGQDEKINHCVTLIGDGRPEGGFNTASDQHQGRRIQDAPDHITNIRPMQRSRDAEKEALTHWRLI